MSRRLLLCLPVVLAACSRAPSPSPSPSASASSTPAPQEPPRLQALRTIENTRAIDLLQEEDLASGQLAVRRQAVRALAETRRPSTVDKLLSCLADDDPEVLSWAAYGLGEQCELDRPRIVSQLVARTVSLQLEPPAPGGALSPWPALYRALGRCGSEQAEKTLVSQLSTPSAQAESAAFALGDIASRSKRLEEDSSASLLRAYSGNASSAPLAAALYPFGRLKQAPPRLLSDLVQSCQKGLSQPNPQRLFALRALGLGGEKASRLLYQALTSVKDYTPEERAEAASALGKIGSGTSQNVLLQAVSQLSPAPDPVSLSSLVGPGFGPLWTALNAIRPAEQKPDKDSPLRALAKLPVPPAAPASLSRRVVQLRCVSASLLCGADYAHPLLMQCASEAHPLWGSLARITVLGRAPLRGARLAAWKQYLEPSQPPRVRIAALTLLASHDEVPDAASLLAQALGAKEPGVVATAAELLADHPKLAQVSESSQSKRKARKAKPSDDALSSEVVKALQEAMARSFPADAIETTGMLARALGSLGLQSSQPWLEKLCGSPSPTLRAHAQSSLTLLEGKKIACDQVLVPYEPSSELTHLVQSPVVVRIESEVGTLRLRLNPAFAPVAATRFVDLVRAHFFDGMAVHRVVPGFVVQFGDPEGDGYGGANLPALRCETAPVPFAAASVGVALGGRDTGSSQFFVTLSATPHLDGQYAWIGQAEGPWNALTEGDVFQRVLIEP